MGTRHATGRLDLRGRSLPTEKLSNVAALSAGVMQRAGERRVACKNYCQKLRDHLERFGIALDESDRMTTATATLRLLERINQNTEQLIVDALASAGIATSEAAMGECASNGGTLIGVLDGPTWEIFDAIAQLADERKGPAAAILLSVVETLRCDEHARPLGPTLNEAHSKALRLLTTARTPTPQPQPSSPPFPPRNIPITRTPTPSPGRTLIDQGSDSFDDIAGARIKLDELAQKLSVGRTVRVTIDWQIEVEPKSR